MTATCIFYYFYFALFPSPVRQFSFPFVGPSFSVWIEESGKLHISIHSASKKVNKVELAREVCNTLGSQPRIYCAPCRCMETKAFLHKFKLSFRRACRCGKTREWERRCRCIAHQFMRKTENCAKLNRSAMMLNEIIFFFPCCAHDARATRTTRSNATRSPETLTRHSHTRPGKLSRHRKLKQMAKQSSVTTMSSRARMYSQISWMTFGTFVFGDPTVGRHISICNSQRMAFLLHLGHDNPSNDDRILSALVPLRLPLSAASISFNIVHHTSRIKKKKREENSAEIS